MGNFTDVFSEFSETNSEHSCHLQSILFHASSAAKAQTVMSFQDSGVITTITSSLKRNANCYASSESGCRVCVALRLCGRWLLPLSSGMMHQLSNAVIGTILLVSTPECVVQQ